MNVLLIQCDGKMPNLPEESAQKHGMYGTPEYIVWGAMKQRCLNPNNSRYSEYGGRGIGVCRRWQEFAAFFADLGPKPTPSHSIDRPRNNEGYNCGTCADCLARGVERNGLWATRSEQARNKRTNRLLTFNGTTKTLTEWAQELGIDDATLHERLQKWPLARALSQKKVVDKNGQAGPHGSRQGCAKLTEQDIPEIRRLLASGVLEKEIAKQYGVSRGSIGDIRHRRTWRHV